MSMFSFSIEASSGNSDIVPVVKYNAKAGRMFRVDRTNNGSEYVTDEVDITRSFRALFDLENIEQGWMRLMKGVAPDFALVPLGAPLPPKPSDEYKQGARIMIKLGKDCGGDIREISSSARVFLAGLEALYEGEYKAQKDANPGKLPVVILKDTLTIKGQQDVNFQPVFEIVGWAPRGVLIFKPRGKGASAPSVPTIAPPATGSTRVPPPVARTPEPAMADADFG